LNAPSPVNYLAGSGVLKFFNWVKTGWTAKKFADL